MLLVPAVPLAAGVHSQFIYPRFFSAWPCSCLLALASLGARGWRRGGAVRLMVCGALALITLGNLVSVARLVRDGRGPAGRRGALDGDPQSSRPPHRGRDR